MPRSPRAPALVAFAAGHADGACQTSSLGQVTLAANPGATWQLFNGTLTTWPAAASLTLQLQCVGNAAFTVRADDVFLGEGLVPVELQSFTLE